MAVLPESPYDPIVLTDELGKLFGLALRPDLIATAGWSFECGPGDEGLLEMRLVTPASGTAVVGALNRARR